LAKQFQGRRFLEIKKQNKRWATQAQPTDPLVWICMAIQTNIYKNILLIIIDRSFLISCQYDI
jgi:hypothetical protein